MQIYNHDTSKEQTEIEIICVRKSFFFYNQLLTVGPLISKCIIWVNNTLDNSIIYQQKIRLLRKVKHQHISFNQAVYDWLKRDNSRAGRQLLVTSELDDS